MAKNFKNMAQEHRTLRTWNKNMVPSGNNDIQVQVEKIYKVVLHETQNKYVYFFTFLVCFSPQMS
jgi:hypothetical protein